MTCICERRDAGDGVERIEWLAVECPEHGRAPGAPWRAGDPLRRHAKVVDRRDGAVLSRDEAHERLREEKKPWADKEWTVSWESLFRDELPYEVEQRLLREAAVRFPLPLRPCPPRELGQR